MQAYIGLDIATNKPTKEEMGDIPHHLFGVWDPFGPSKDVRDFRDAAVRLISEIHGRGNLPILCGGTHYWIKSVLWHTLLDERSSQPSGKKQKLDQSEDPYNLLASLDPDSAAKIHPNDTRKIARALEVYSDQGMMMSEVVSMQQCESLRYKCATLIWVHADDLDTKLDERVEKMINRGLIDEFNEFRGRISGDIDTEHGIFQAIGFKELLNDPVDGTSKMRTATRKYARKQVSYIQSQIAPLVNLPARLYKIADIDEAISIAHATISGDFDGLTSECEPFTPKKAPGIKYKCELCHKMVHGETEWKKHLKSRGHRRQTKKKA